MSREMERKINLTLDCNYDCKNCIYSNYGKNLFWEDGCPHLKELQNSDRSNYRENKKGDLL